MKLDFGEGAMEVGSFAFNFMRTLMVAGTGGAELNECLHAVAAVKDGDIESWVVAWAKLAEQVGASAALAKEHRQDVTARHALLRTSNYYRAAGALLPASDARFDSYLSRSRTAFHEAIRLSPRRVEVLELPFEQATLPGYFVSAGAPRRPTLLVLNGGDSTNEEMVHWLGFAAAERGWNCLVFEGPGQWSALQLNPGLTMRPDYEQPVRSVVDYLVRREDVDAGKIALYGPSLGSLLGARVLAFEDRICAGILDGLVVDFYEAWHAVWPRILQKAPAEVFDLAFGFFERLSPQLRGIVNHFRFIFGAESAKPHEIIDGLKPYNVRELAPQIRCPLMVMWGEAEVAQSNEAVALSALRFLKALRCPLTVRMFGYEEGWAASHCRIGALATLQASVFEWLERAVNEPTSLETRNTPARFLDVFHRYVRSPDAKRESEGFLVNAAPQ